jgi:hypothetical protein
MNLSELRQVTDLLRTRQQGWTSCVATMLELFQDLAGRERLVELSESFNLLSFRGRTRRFGLIVRGRLDRGSGLLSAARSRRGQQFRKIRVRGRRRNGPIGEFARRTATIPAGRRRCGGTAPRARGLVRPGERCVADIPPIGLACVCRWALARHAATLPAEYGVSRTLLAWQRLCGSTRLPLLKAFGRRPQAGPNLRGWAGIRRPQQEQP